MNLPFFSRKRVIILIHLVCWVLLFLLPSLFRPAQEDTNKIHSAAESGFFYLYICNFLCWICLFYVNSHFLIPRLIYTRRYIKYGLSLIPVFLFLSLINWLGYELFAPVPYNYRGFIAFFLLPCLFILSSSTAITMFQNRLQTDRLSQQKETENLKTELAFLRSQVSPHFMFNVLNNMVVLARKKSDALEPSLFKLSTLMRYMLYETDEKKVPLEREVEYLNSYIDLQLQRFGKKVELHLDMEDIDKAYLIEPMLLIPFVENAFKHGTGFKQKGDIQIRLKARNHRLEFQVGNYYDGTVQHPKDRTSGIGLQNVRRRLDLLYGDQYALQITDKENRFCVSLTIHLHPC